MKYRHGFVTNSSSTSYIIAFKKGVWQDKQSIRNMINKAYKQFIQDEYVDGESSFLNDLKTWYGDDATIKELKDKATDILYHSYISATGEYGAELGEYKLTTFSEYEPECEYALVEAVKDDNVVVIAK